MINRDDLMTSDVNQPYDPDMCICRYELYTSETVMDQYIILGLIEKVLFLLGCSKILEHLLQQKTDTSTYAPS